MLKFIEKRKGAISIFLVIILLPMLTVASIMVDMSRIKLGKAVASSAGDLALNTSLTCYDNVLKEMYGLMASSQDYDELMKNLEDYYAKTIRSSGVSEELTENYVDSIMNKLAGIDSSSDGASLLNMELVKFKDITKEEASLANPALLKSQIVNYMKYRGPMEFGLGFLDSLKSFTTIGEQVEVIDARKEYYQERATVVESCEDAWANISKYNKVGLTEDTFKTWHSSLSLVDQEYRFVTSNIVWDYYGVKDGFSESTHTYAVEKNGDFEFYWQGKKVETKISKVSQMTDYVEAIDQAIANFKEEVASENSKKMCLGETKGVYDIKQVAYYQKDVKDKKGYPKAAYDLYTSYNNFIEAKKLLEEYIEEKEEEISNAETNLAEIEDKLEEAKDELSKLEKELEAIDNPIQKIIENFKSDISKIKKQIKEYEDKIENNDENVEKLKQDIEEKKQWLKASFNGKSLDTLEKEYTSYYKDEKTLKNFSKITHGMKSVINGSKTLKYKGVDKKFTNKQLVDGSFSNEIIKQRAQELSQMQDKLDQGIDYLTNAKKCLEDIEKKVRPGGALMKSEDKWRDKASKDAIKETSISEQNLAELETVQEFINHKEVEELLAHVEGALKTLNKAKEEISEFKYGKSSIEDIKSIDDAVKAIKDEGYGEKLEKVKALETKLRDLDEEIYKGMYSQPDQILTYSWSELIENPQLEKADHNFYGYLKQLFDEIVEEGGDLKKQKEEGEKVKKDTEDRLEEYTDMKDDDPDESPENKVEGSKFQYLDNGNLPSNQWVHGLKDKLIDHNKAAEAEYEAMSSQKMQDIKMKEGKPQGSSIISFFKNLGNALKNLGIDMRDNMFISGYIMNMFSYDTYEKEKIYEAKGSKMNLAENLVKQNQIKVNDRVYTTACYKEDGSFHNPVKESEAKETLTAKDFTNMSGVAISPMYNAAYLSEIEYIIYGTNGSAASYGTIYAIRSGFNMVYAFSDTQISSMAQGIATSIFGTPPLTFMVPIAKAAIIIGVALAESALDIACFKAGMAVPIYKTKETWILSVDNLLGKAKDAAKEVVAREAKDIAGSMVDQGTNQLNKWLSMTDEQMKELVSEGSQAAEDMIDSLGYTVTDTITKAVEQYIATAVDQVISLYEETKTKVVGGKFLTDEERIIYIENKLNEWLSKEEDKDSIMYKAKAAAVEYLIVEGEIENLVAWLNDLEQKKEIYLEGAEDISSFATDELLNKFNEDINELVNVLTNHIVQAEEEIRGYIDQASNAAMEAVNKGSKELKDTINKSIDDLMGTSGKVDKSFVNTNVTGTLYSFQYSDYLQLFLLMALMVNQEGILLRTADVIQTNTGLAKYGAEQLTAHTSGEAKGYQLQDSYTYVEIEATIEVKPLFMKLPFVEADSPDGIKENRNWYTIKYRGVQGY